MKKIIVYAVVFLTFGLFTGAPVKAQVRFHVNINIGSQPAWGPQGYDYVEYYYLPDIEAYYYVPSRQFIYLSGNRWIFSASLPPRYGYYNINTGYKVVVNQPNAYMHFNEDRMKYSRYRGNWGRQPIIRNSNNPKYFVIRDHPKYRGDRGQDRGQDRGRGRNH